MSFRTGQTIYEQIVSLDLDNNPVTGATFDTVIYRDGVIDSGISISMALSDSTRAMFTASWSASTDGDYQLYAKNNSTDVVYISDIIHVRPDSELYPNIYIGL